MLRTVDTVERAISREISFVNHAQNTEVSSTKRIEKIESNRIVINKKDGLCSREKMLYSLSFLCALI